MTVRLLARPIMPRSVSSSKRYEVGASVCVYVDGKPVVDLWGGFADTAHTQPWDRNTLVNVASTTKGMVAMCTHMLVERGLLDLDAHITRYWPEFAQGENHSPRALGAEPSSRVAGHSEGFHPTGAL